MHKRVYRLGSIGKILTFAPPLFILLLTALSLVTLFFVMEHRKSSKIEFYTQQQNLMKYNHLSDFVGSVEKQITRDLAKVDAKLKRSVHILKGISIGQEEQSDMKKFISHVKIQEEKLKTKGNIKFLIFDSELNILHGQKLARNIRDLIFGKKKGKTHLDIVLMYIKSQGDESSISWRDDITKTIQLSYFVGNDDMQIYIGAFSSIDYFKNLTTTAYINAIASGIYNLSNFYFWLYKETQDMVYNFNNHMI